MRETSRVPPSRRHPETAGLPDEAGRPDEAALAAPSPAPEDGEPPAAAPAAGAGSGTGRAPVGPPLPQRVRGANGARPPARVDRPVLPESFAERFQAAVAASKAREAEESARESGATAPEASNENAPVSAPSAPEPVAKNGGAMLPPPFTLMDPNERDGVAEASTEPIPVVSGPVQAGGPAASLADQQAAPPRPPGGQATSAARAQADGQADGADASAAWSAWQAPPRPAVTTPAASGPAEPGLVPAPREPGTAPGKAAQGQAGKAAQGQAGKAARGQAGKRRPRRGYQMAGFAVIVLALAIAAGIFAALHYRGHGGRARLIPSAELPPGIRNGAGSWVASQIAAGDTVACDPVMCRVLQTDGMPSARLRVLWPGSDDVSGCAVIVATPVLQAQLGTRLDSVDAPAVIATFGSGDRRIAVRAVAPRGPATYRSDLGKDLSVRRAAGAELAGQAAALLSAAEKRQLSAGQVDSRLIVVLADIEGKQRVPVSAFGDPSPGVGPAAAPLRSVDLTVTSAASLRSILAELGAAATQDPRYRAARVQTMRVAGGQAILRIQFAAPSLLGLLGY